MTVLLNERDMSSSLQNLPQPSSSSPRGQSFLPSQRCTSQMIELSKQVNWSSPRQPGGGVGVSEVMQGICHAMQLKSTAPE